MTAAMGAAMTRMQPSQRKSSFGQDSVFSNGANLLITSADIMFEARSMQPIWSSLAVSPMGMRMSTKSRKRRMSRRAIMIASGSAAMSST